MAVPNPFDKFDALPAANPFDKFDAPPLSSPDVIVPSIKRTAGQFAESAGTALEDITGPNVVTRGLQDFGGGVVKANPAQIQSAGDILTKPWTAIKETVAEQVPQLGAALTGARLGAMAGAPFGPVVAAGGALIGGLTPIFLQEYAEVRGKQKDTGEENIPLALAGAGVASALERVGLEKVASKIGAKGVKEALGVIPAGASRLKHISKEALKTAAIEGPLTEVPQTVIERYTGGQEVGTPEALSEYALAGGKGALGGGVIGGALGAVAPREQVAPAVPPGVVPPPAPTPGPVAPDWGTTTGVFPQGQPMPPGAPPPLAPAWGTTQGAGPQAPPPSGPIGKALAAAPWQTALGAGVTTTPREDISGAYRDQEIAALLRESEAQRERSRDFGLALWQQREQQGDVAMARGRAEGVGEPPQETAMQRALREAQRRKYEEEAKTVESKKATIQGQPADTQARIPADAAAVGRQADALGGTADVRAARELRGPGGLARASEKPIPVTPDAGRGALAAGGEEGGGVAEGGPRVRVEDQSGEGVAGAGAQALASVSDNVFHNVGELGPAGEITEGRASSADWEILKRSGLMQTGTSEDGTPYNYVPAAALYPERERRFLKERAKAKVTEEEKARGVENRARNYERLAKEQEGLGELGDLDKAKEYRAKAAAIRKSGIPRAEIVTAEESPKVKKGEREAIPERRTDISRRKAVAAMTPEELRREILTDGLTGLPNRRAYDDTKKLPVQVSVDLDALKFVNDAMGHSSGDEMLRAFGEALLGETRQAYRVGGDEFVVQASTEAMGRFIMERVAKRLAGARVEVTLPDGSIISKTGVGFSYGIGGDYAAADEALKGHKAEREASGQRPVRGAEPPGVERRDGGVAAKPPEGEPREPGGVAAEVKSGAVEPAGAAQKEVELEQQRAEGYTGEAKAVKHFDERLSDAATQRALSAMAANSGWETRGGQLLRDADHKVVGRTTWIPRETWFAELPERLNEAATVEAVKKAIAGEKLGAKERRVVGYMLDAMGREREEGAVVADEEAEAERAAIVDEALNALQTEDIDNLFGYDTLNDNEIEEFFGEPQAGARGTEETDAAGTPGGDRAPSAQARPAGEPLLEAYSETELREREEARVATERREAEETAARLKKEEADKALADFVLAGSKREADELAARGQASLFDQSAATKPAKEKAKRPIAKAPPSKEELTDVGEKIEGARKDLWAGRALGHQDIAGMNERELQKFVTKEHVFPRPNYQAIADHINAEFGERFDAAKQRFSEEVRALDMGAGSALLIKKIRDSIENPPLGASRESLEDYLTAVGMVRKALEDLEHFIVPTGSNLVKLAFGDDIVSGERYHRWNHESPNWKYLNALGNKFARIAQVDARDWARALMEADKTGFPKKQEVWQRDYRVFQKGDLKIGKGTKFIEGKPIDVFFLGAHEGRFIKDFPTRAEAEVAIKAYAPYLVMAKKRGNLVKQVDTEAEGINFARDTYKAQHPTVKREDKTPELRHIVRDGQDYRGGRDVGDNEFKDAFGFRGVQFGNWTDQRDRQQSLNHAYDALMDLAAALGVPPQALSLNGELGLAFGARGGGKAAAHYEPTRVVINLTKTAGAGSAAHEWAHALDDYFGRISGDLKGKKSPFVSHGVSAKSAMRPEMVQAFKDVMSAINYRLQTQSEVLGWTQADIEKSAKYIASWLKGMRGELKDAERDGSGFDALAAAVQDAAGDARAERDALISYMGEKNGKLPSKERRNGLNNNLDWRRRYYQRLNKAMSGEATPAKLPSTYAKLSAAKGPYWARAHELFARAFESFMLDKLAGEGRRSDYLVHPGKQAREETDPDYPYPAGAERTNINAAFEKFVGAIAHKTTEKGVALYSYAGERGAKVPQHALAAAREYAEQGVPMEEIRKTTGWFRGKDDRWRYEISDKDAKLKEGWDGYGKTLGEAISHPHLFENYPSLAQIEIVHRFDLPANTAGGYDHKTNTINLNASLGPKGALSIILHELQHAVQFIEGFAVGGNPMGPWAIKEAKAFGIDTSSPDARYTAYLRLMGEVEARDVQARAHLTAKELRDRPPYVSQGIPESAFIIRHKRLPISGKDAVIKTGIHNAKTVGEALDHPRLFDKYPELREIGLRWHNDWPPEIEGGYNHDDNIINLNAAMPLDRLRTTILKRLEEALDDRGVQAAVTAGQSAAGLRANLVRRLGSRAIEGLERAGFEIVEREDQLPENLRPPAGEAVRGVYWKGKSYLVAGNIPEGAEISVLLHEVGVHHGLEGLLGTKLHRALLGNIKAILSPLERAIAERKSEAELNAIRQRIAAQSPLAKALVAARGRVPNKTRAGHINEEVLAYTVEDNANRNLTLVKRVMAAIRAWLLRHGFKLKEIRPEDLVALARASVRAVSREATVQRGVPADALAMFAKELGVSAEQLRKEYEAVESRYRGTPQWMKAPNGEPTKLNERQWVLARTPRFKAWFGEWEALARRDALEGMTPFVITPGSIGAATSTPEAVRLARETYRGLQTETAKTTDGRRVRFGGVGFRETAHHAADRRVLEIIPQLPELLNKALPLWSDGAPPADRNIKAFHHYGIKTRFARGEAYVRLVVREEVNGDFYYDNDATAVEEIRQASKQPPLPRAKAGARQLPMPVRNRLVAWWRAVNPDTASKVLDENGEPQVVYHGTGEDFAVFDKTKIGRPGFGHGFHLAEQPEVANFYAAQWNRGERTGAPRT